MSKLLGVALLGLTIPVFVSTPLSATDVKPAAVALSTSSSQGR